MKSLPIALTNEPLIDALFELRLSEGSVSLADILPGFLLHQLKLLNLKPKLIRLPTAEIPQPIRMNDPNLPFQGLIRIDTGSVLIIVGDRSLTVASHMPYMKWPNFKNEILKIVESTNSLGIDNKVDRFSLKYTNLISGSTISDQIAKINLSINVGKLHVENNPLNMQVHKIDDPIIHIITVATGAEASTSDGRHMTGAILDIDSIKNLPSVEFQSFSEHLDEDIAPLRRANKELFFDCLTDAALEEFGPIYEPGS